MELDPEKVLEKDWVEIYKNRMNALHAHMSEIWTTFFLYEKIVDFPFHLFAEHHGFFWTLTRKSMFVSIIIGLWKILYDDDSKSLTIIKMRNEVMKRAINKMAKNEISELLRQANVKERLANIKNEIQRIRHKHFAHLDIINIDKPSSQQPKGILLKEILDLLNAAGDVINAIGLGTQYEFLPGEYHPAVHQPIGVDSRPDIEIMLDEMVQSCSDFHLPEEKPYEFQHYWKNLNFKEQRVFNQYRRKFGMQEIDIEC